jgi:hypothetical protein
MLGQSSPGLSGTIVASGSGTGTAKDALYDLGDSLRRDESACDPITRRRLHGRLLRRPNTNFPRLRLRHRTRRTRRYRIHLFPLPGCVHRRLLQTLGIGFQSLCIRSGLRLHAGLRFIGTRTAGSSENRNREQHERKIFHIQNCKSDWSHCYCERLAMASPILIAAVGSTHLPCSRIRSCNRSTASASGMLNFTAVFPTYRFTFPGAPPT